MILILNDTGILSQVSNISNNPLVRDLFVSTFWLVRYLFCINVTSSV